MDNFEALVNYLGPLHVLWQVSFGCWVMWSISSWQKYYKIVFFPKLSHIRRFQEYFNHINILISSSTLQFLQFWYQNGVNYLFFIVKSKEVTSGFISKVMKKFLGGATVELFDI